MIKAGIILTVFIVAMIVTSRIINTDSTDMTTEMESATFPVVSIEYNGTEINRMFGYVSELKLYERQHHPINDGTKNKYSC